MGQLQLVSTHTFTGRYTKSADLTEPIESINITTPTDGQRYVNGTGSGKANIIIDVERTLSVASETLDLTSTFADAFGDTALFVELKELHVWNKATNTANILTMSGNALNNLLGGSGPTVKIGPIGVCHLASPIDGFAIVNTTGDQLKFEQPDPSQGDIVYRLVLVGEV